MAWRNIWRSPWRSIVVIGSMALGVWAGIFMMGWATGLNDARTVSLLDDNVGHGRITSAAYEASPEAAALIPQLATVLENISRDTAVTAVAPRLVLQAMIQSGSGAAPALVLGVYPEAEQAVFKAARTITAGTFLGAREADEIVLGEELARRLEVDVDDRVVLTFQDLAGEVHSALFYVVGLYDGASNLLEETMLYVPAWNIASQMGMLDSTLLGHEFPVAHQLNFRVQDPYAMDHTVNQLRMQDSLRLHQGFIQSRIESLATLERHSTPLVIKEWRSISPELGYADEIMAQSLLLFMTIILLAMAFGNFGANTRVGHAHGGRDEQAPSFLPHRDRNPPSEFCRLANRFGPGPWHLGRHIAHRHHTQRGRERLGRIWNGIHHLPDHRARVLLAHFRTRFYSRFSFCPLSGAESP